MHSWWEYKSVQPLWGTVPQKPENRAIMKVKALVAQSYLTLFDPMDCSLPSSSVHGICQARTLEWVAIPFSRGSSWPWNQTQVSYLTGRFFTIWATREAPQNHHMIQQFHFWVYIQRKGNHYLEKISALPCLLQHYSQQPRYRSKLRCGIYRY